MLPFVCRRVRTACEPRVLGLPLHYDCGCRSRMGPSLLLGLRESTRFGVEECEDAAPAADLVCLPWLLGTLHGFPEELRAGSTQRQSSPAAGRMMMCMQRVVLPPLPPLSAEEHARGLSSHKTGLPTPWPMKYCPLSTYPHP